VWRAERLHAGADRQFRCAVLVPRRRFDAALLARVPLEQQGIACICRRCVEAARDAAS
jgi:hypothetical protein